MDPAISRQLVDKMYEKRKAAALELEKQIRECNTQNDHRRVSMIIDQLVDMFRNPTNPLHVKNGGLIGLAGSAIALGVDVAPYMERFLEPLLSCFSDPENRIRYFSAECLYNIAKVSKGEILVYFNPIFDALSKLAADSELSVKNGAELLDRLLKDIVAESASVYVPQHFLAKKVVQPESNQSIVVPYPDELNDGQTSPVRKAFSLAQFIPLLADRIHVVSPFTRSFLVSWITVLDSVPELELITYLPEFLDGLLKYLSDPIEDVRIATENLLSEFLKEIRMVARVRRYTEDKELENSRHRRQAADGSTEKKLEDITMTQSNVTGRGVFIPEDALEGDSTPGNEKECDADDNREVKDAGVWIPGQGITVDHAAVVEILIRQLDNKHDEIQQSTALSWLHEFFLFAHDVMVPFTPRLIPAILPNIAHHAPMIQREAIRTNEALMDVIRNLPDPVTPSKDVPPVQEKQLQDKSSVGSSSRPGTVAAVPAPGASPPSVSPLPTRQATMSKEQLAIETSGDVTASPASDRTAVVRRNTIVPATTNDASTVQEVDGSSSRGPSPTSTTSAAIVGSQPNSLVQSQVMSPQEIDPFDYQATVNVLTIQFLSEHEETRVEALKWLIMLHQKAPKKILAMDDGTFPALLKTLSDSSEDVIKQDLKLLAQISSSSEEGYFRSFMGNLLELFSTDRRLVETRGSLIIRQLCLHLNTENIFKTLGEILEKEEDLEFASVMVEHLNVILITAPELAYFRKRLKTLETRQDGQAIFTTLYRSWCHNAVATFALCLLAQAYEHASNLLSIFAELEITVPLLVQIDKLVQLIESPVFTYIRLQLLEPEKYPYLFKCLYGLLMILPQSSAFSSLRNRLNAVNSAGFLHITPRSNTAPFSARSKLGRGEEIKWQELLTHFRSVQGRHEKARRQAMGMEDYATERHMPEPIVTAPRPNSSRRRTGEGLPVPPSSAPMRGGVPSSNRQRGPSQMMNFGGQSNTLTVPRPGSPNGVLQSKPRRTATALPPKTS